MTSFELFKLLKFGKSTFHIYFSTFFLLKYIICDKLHQIIKKIKYFATNYGMISSVIIKLSKKSCRKQKVGVA